MASQLRRNVIANFVGRGWLALMQLGFVPVYVGFLGVEAFGLVGIFASLLAIFSVLDFGLSTTLNRELATSSQTTEASQVRDLVRTLEWVCWLIAFAIGLMLTATAPFLVENWIRAETLSPATVNSAITLMGWAIALQWSSSLYSGGLLGLQQQVLFNVITCAIATARAVGATIVLWWSPSIEAFFMWQAVVGAVQTLLLRATLWKALPRANARAHFRWSLLQRMRRFAAGMIGISLTSVLLMHVDKIILSKLLTLDVLGYYTLASMLAGAIFYIVTPVFAAVFPRFSQLIASNNREGLRSLYHQSCQFVSVIVLPTTLVIALYSKEIIILWTGSKVIGENSYLILSMLIIGNALNGLMHLPYALQLAHGRTHLTLSANVAAIFVLTPLTYLLTVRFGPIGAAAAWIALTSAYLVVVIQMMREILPRADKYRWYGIDIFLPLVGAVIALPVGTFLVGVEDSRLRTLVVLFAITSLSILGSAVVTPYTREWLLRYIKARAGLA